MRDSVPAWNMLLLGSYALSGTDVGNIAARNKVALEEVYRALEDGAERTGTSAHLPTPLLRYVRY